MTNIDNNEDEFDNADFEEEFDFDESDDEAFDESEVAPAQTAQKPPRPPGGTGGKSKYLAIAGVIGAAIIGYGIYSTMKSSGDKMIDLNPNDLSVPALNEVATTRASNEQTPTPSQPTKQASSQTSPETDWSKMNDMPFNMEEEQASTKLKEVIANLEQQKATSTKQIKALENTLDKIVEAMQKMDNKMSLLGKEVTSAAESISTSSKEIAELKAKQQTFEESLTETATKLAAETLEKRIKDKSTYTSGKSTKQSQADNMSAEMTEDGAMIPKPKAKPKPPEHLSSTTKAQQAFSNTTWKVHAIIPGRVWLKNENGQSITVTEGEVIEGFGKVLAIDAPSSSVVTSSGRVIR